MARRLHINQIKFGMVVGLVAVPIALTIRMQQNAQLVIDKGPLDRAVDSARVAIFKGFAAIAGPEYKDHPLLKPNPNLAPQSEQLQAAAEQAGSQAASSAAVQKPVASK